MEALYHLGEVLWLYVTPAISVLTLVEISMRVLKHIGGEQVTLLNGFHKIRDFIGVLLHPLWISLKTLFKLCITAMLLASLLSVYLRASEQDDFVTQGLQVVLRKLEPLPQPSAECARYQRIITGPMSCNDSNLDIIGRLSCQVQVPKTEDRCVERRTSHGLR
ncbi:hypothetical protein [Rhodomicrobium lacus]|uniref:hypothetical protein n=1 Tax=Rhodomicrobium lacus TaxID=2498452 RepID=UPI0026E4659F|nr:hypothetical protein [Rhodomicrobium lacus]WKW52200.1 hypothetical protein QMO75_06925 [Rhodomicrobium lacus]